jgi:hypothetical protein
MRHLLLRENLPLGPLPIISAVSICPLCLSSLSRDIYYGRNIIFVLYASSIFFLVQHSTFSYDIQERGGRQRGDEGDGDGGEGEERKGREPCDKCEIMIYFVLYEKEGEEKRKEERTRLIEYVLCNDSFLLNFFPWIKSCV